MPIEKCIGNIVETISGYSFGRERWIFWHAILYKHAHIISAPCPICTYLQYYRNNDIIVMTFYISFVMVLERMKFQFALWEIFNLNNPTVEYQRNWCYKLSCPDKGAGKSSIKFDWYLVPSLSRHLKLKYACRNKLKRVTLKVFEKKCRRVNWRSVNISN